MFSKSSRLITKSWKPFVTVLKRKDVGDIAALIRKQSVSEEVKVAYVAAFTIAQYMHEGDTGITSKPHYPSPDTVSCIYFLNETSGRPNCSKCILNHRYPCSSFNSKLLQAARQKYKHRYTKCS